MTIDYPGQSFGGSVAPNITTPSSINSSWIPELLVGIHKRQLSATKSERWLNKLGIIEDNFYGDVVQQYSASFPRAYRYNYSDKPNFLSNWGINTNVITSRINWQRVYGIDIDKSELSKIMDNNEEIESFIGNNIQEAINSANLEELALITYGLESMLSDVTILSKDNCFQELLAEVDSHLGYVVNESFISSDNDVIILTDFATSARLKSLPSLRYVDRASRERILDKVVSVPFIPDIHVTTKEITVTSDMISNNVLIENYREGDIIPKGSLILDTTYFNPSDIKRLLVDTQGNIPNLFVYDKRSIFIGKRPTLFNWSDIEGDINFNHQDLHRGLLSQNTLERSMNVSFCNLFKMRAFRYNYL